MLLLSPRVASLPVSFALLSPAALTSLQALLKDPLYIGLRHKRVRGQAYDDLLDEFMKAVADRYSATSLIFNSSLAHFLRASAIVVSAQAAQGALKRNMLSSLA